MISNVFSDVGSTILDYLPGQTTELDDLVRQYQTSTFLSRAKLFFKLPVQIQKYFRLWSLFSVYSTLSFILQLPFQIVFFVIGNPLLYLLGKTIQNKTITYYSVLTLLALLILTRDSKLFDISFLYHSFRGQSTLKFYGLLFAFQVSQKLLTVVGSSILKTLGLPTRDSSVWDHLQVWLCSLAYLTAHTFSIYLQFVVFIVVINSQFQNFIIYCFVMNLTKMKSTAFKKFDQASYKSQINYDMKDRMQKMVYLVLFAFSQSNREVENYYSKLACVFLVGAIIEWIKHTTVINLSEKKINVDEVTKDLLKGTGSRTKMSVIKCIEIDYNVLPLATFILKMIFTIYYTKNTSIHLTSPLPMATFAAIVLEILMVPIASAIFYLLKAIFAHTGGDQQLMSEEQP